MDKKKEEISLHTKEVEQIIEKYLPKEEGFQKKVIEAMNYSFLAGGKRLRPMLMLETYRLFGGKGKVIEPFMAAIEMIHTYSLVHDDLPAMDNDALRRGKPTTHKAFGEAMAILAGDGLLNFAYETAALAFQMELQNVRVGEAHKRKTRFYLPLKDQRTDRGVHVSRRDPCRRVQGRTGYHRTGGGRDRAGISDPG